MWEFYRNLGAVHYGVNFKKNAAAKVTYFAAQLGDDDPEPTDNQQVIEAVARLQSRYGDINEIVAELMVHLNVPGEGYLIGEAGLDGEEWDVWSVAEVQAASQAGGMPKPDQAIIEGDVFAARIWRPDPEHRHLADSPLRPVADQCEQLLLLDDSIAAAAKSRLSAGLFYLPTELDIGDQNTFEDQMIAILTTPIKEHDSASRWSPGLIRGPAEYADKIKQISFSREIDATFAAMREELTRAIAAGLDLPAEIVTGKGDLSHWNAWEIDESAFRDHIDPDIILIMDSITRGYLRPALEEGGMGDDEAKQFLIWRDLSDLGQRPPTIPEATALYDRQLVSAEYMRGLINAGEDDAPEVEDIPVVESGPVEAVGVGIARGEPGQEQAGLTTFGFDSKELGERVNAVGVLYRSGFLPEAALAAMGLPPIAHTGFLPVTVKVDTPPDPSAAVLDPNAPEPGPTVQPQAVPEALVAAEPAHIPLTGLSRIDETLFDRISEATEAAFHRVLERAGAKIRSHAKKDRAISMTIDRLSNDMVTRHLGEALIMQLQITPSELVPPDSFDPLVRRLRTIFESAHVGVADQLETLTGVKPDLDVAKVQGGIGHYVTQLQGFALRLLFNPLEPGPGEVGDAQVPAGLVVDMMTIAGGGTPAVGPSNVRGFAAGQDSLEFLQQNGYTLAGHRWEYGDAATRRQPFPPHRRLDGAEFTDWTDEQLATPASASFLNVGHMFPGDHFRCMCRTAPVVVKTTVAA